MNGLDAFRSYFNSRFRQVLGILLTIDAVLILAHLAIVLGYGKDSFPDRLLAFDINSDHNLGEIFGYAKLASLVVLALWFGARMRSPVFPAVAFFFLLILLDDALQIHERLGARVAHRIPAGLGGMAHDLGEIAIWLALGMPALAALAWGFWRASPRFRIAALAMVVPLLATLAFTGVFLDVVSAVIGRSPEGSFKMPLRIVFGILEDGGEMIAISLGLAIAAGVAAVHGPRRQENRKDPVRNVASGARRRQAQR